MLHKCFYMFLMAMILGSCSSSINPPITDFRMEMPRPFGYVIGDKIKQRIIVETREGLELQYSSMPGKGEIDRWLTLNAIKVKKNKNSTGFRYQIEFIYQLVYAPLEVKMIELPAFTLRFKQFGKVIEKQVPSWHFTAAPLRELAIRKDNGVEYMRPDTPAPFLDNSSNFLQLVVFLSVALLVSVYLLWIYGLISFFPKYGFFKYPYKKITKLPDSEFAKMLKLIHQALNQLNGKPLFQHTLSRFYQRFPDFRQLDDDFQWFFNRSNRYFFGYARRPKKEDINRIKLFCRHCLEVERGIR